MKRLLLFLACGGCDPDMKPPSPTLGIVRTVRPGVTIRRPGADEAGAAGAWQRVEIGGVVETDATGWAALEHDGGAWLLLDSRTKVEIAADAIRILSGRAWVDGRKVERTKIVAGDAELVFDDAGFDVSMGREGVRAYVAAGEVTFKAGREEGRVEEGDTGVFGRGRATVSPEELWDDWTGGLAEPGPRRARGAQGVGQVWARTEYEIGQARSPLAIRAHEVRVAVTGDLARTEVDQTFFNPRSENVEGIYEIRVPLGATVESFATEQFGSLQEGQVQPHARAASEFSGGDLGTAAVLSWAGDGRYVARIAGIEAGKTRRVILRYTEWLSRRGDVRTYVYPMGGDEDAPLVGELAIDVDLSGAGMKEVSSGMLGNVLGERVSIRRSDFRPRADFYLDLWGTKGGKGETSAKTAAFRAPGRTAPEWGGTEDYLYAPLYLPAPERQEGVDLVVLYDDSAATEGGELELGRGVVEAMLRALSDQDRVAVLAADLGAHPIGARSARPAKATNALRERLLEAVARRRPGGATDLAQILVDGFEALPIDRNGAVVYVGDGRATVGELRVADIEERLARLDRSVRFYALGVGPEADLATLDALARGRGFARRIEDRPGAVRVVADLLAEVSRPALTDVSVDFGPTVERVYPGRPQTVMEGEPLRVVGRIRGKAPEKVVVRARQNGEMKRFELALDVKDLTDWGDLQRRWATERLADLFFAGAGREAVAELGVRYALVTPATSMVVGWGGPLPPMTPEARPDVRDEDSGRASAAAWQPFAEDELGFAEGGFAADDRADLAMEQAVRQGRHASTEEVYRTAIAARTDVARQCFESRARARPDLAGGVGVKISVQPSGDVATATVDSTTVPDPAVGDCIARQVDSMRLPRVPSVVQNVTFVYMFNFFATPQPLHEARQCSGASKLPVDVRRRLWRERLEQAGGVDGAMAVWTRAGQDCELRSWRDRRTLLDLMLVRLGGAVGGIALHRAFEGERDVQSYLRRQILRRVRNARELRAVREGLLLGYWVDWALFDRLIAAARDDRARIAIVREFLAVDADDVDLRLRLMGLLEKVGDAAEARRVAFALLASPESSPRVRGSVGEMLVRLGEPDEAKRAFAEIVEFAPGDPWARRRLGDLYRAHGWYEEAYREYETLTRLLPDDDGVLLLLASAAAGAGRMDEALRLEQRLGESAEAGGDPGAPRWARLWQSVRLGRLRDDARRAGKNEDLKALLRRTRSAGVLRDTPALKAFVVWDHPDANLVLSLGYPGSQGLDRAPELGAAFGVEAVILRRREDGTYRFEVEGPKDDPRRFRAEIVVLLGEGSREEVILRQPIELTRERTKVAYLLEANALRAVAPLPPPRPVVVPAGPAR